MKLYEINEALERAIEECIDEETGEITDIERLNSLEIEFEEKVDSICSYIKSLNAEAEAIKAEMANLDKRKKALSKKAESMLGYVERNLAGREFSTARNVIKYRKSESLEVDLDRFRMNENACMYLKVADPVPDKVAIKNAIKAGQNFDGATLVTKMNMSLK